MPLTNSTWGGKTTMLGLDTGYFLRLLKGDTKAKEIWAAIMDGEEAAVSCLTLFELARFARKGSIEAEAEKTLREGILGLCRVCWLDREEALLAAANLSHGIGMHAMDALILSGLLSEKATTIYTTDSDFEAYKKKGVRIVRISSSRTDGAVSCCKRNRNHSRGLPFSGISLCRPALDTRLAGIIN